MTLRQLLIIISIGTTLCWATWLMVVINIDPTTSGTFGFLLFYTCLFCALLGSFFLATFLWRKLFNKNSIEYQIVGTSFRQSFSFGILVILMLVLKSHDLLTWWNMLMVIAGLTLIEFFFLSFKRGR